MGILDKIKGMLKGNKSKATAAVDKVADVVEDKAGSHAAQVEAGAEKAKDVIENL